MKSVLKNKIGKKIVSSHLGRNIYYKILRILGVLFDDESFIRLRYKILAGGSLSLNPPTTFNEKIQWLKLNNRTPLVTQVADKYRVREYVKQKVESDILIPLIGVYDNFGEIDFSLLPEKFILKANHGSGWNVICTDKKHFNPKEAKQKFDLWMRTNYFYASRSWEYKNIAPKIVCEEFLSCKDKAGLEDYKIYCFNGVPTYIQYVSDIIHGNNKDSFYDVDWNKQEFAYTNTQHDYVAEKPDNLNDMLDIAKKLSHEFDFCRIDLYDRDGELYFGEITLHPGSGMDSFTPSKYDKILGNKINLT